MVNKIITKQIKSAFSLIELSVVILIIGILVIGITKGSRIISSSKLSTARSLSKSSPVVSTPNLVAWYDATNEGSIVSGNYNTTTNDTTSVTDGSFIKTWKDVNPQTVTDKRDGSVVNSDNSRPTYAAAGINGLPAISFDGTDDYFSLPNGTIPYGDSGYTIFIVALSKDVTTDRGILGSGDYSTGHCNAIAYTTLGRYYNYWWGPGLIGSSSAMKKDKTQLLVLSYNNVSTTPTIYGFINGTQVNSTGTAPRASLATGNTIGLTSSLSTGNLLNAFMYGYIGEIIIFDRPLTKNEREGIDQYLVKKWSIK